jgi:hypothetical protein
MPETIRLRRRDYLGALDWNGTLWGQPSVFQTLPNDAEINPSYELFCDAVLCATNRPPRN